MIAAPVGARAFGRFGARNMIALSLLLGAIGSLGMNLADVDSTVLPVLLSLTLVNVAVGLMAAGTTSMVMNALPPEKAGMASGTQSTTRQFGGALGIAILGSILASRYASNLTRMLSGTIAARYLPVATRSLAAALQAAPPGTPSHALVTEASKQSFVDAFHLVAWTVAASCVVSAAAVYLVLGRTTEAARTDQPVEVDAGVSPSGTGLSAEEA
jgi:MFS family permease